MNKMLFTLNKVNNLNRTIHIDELKLTGYFSVDNTRSLRLNDSSQLRYYHPPSDVNFDLNEDVESISSQVESISEKRIDSSILHWILDHKEEVRSLDCTEQWLKPNFIFWRLAMIVMMKTPFVNDDWIVCAAKFRGNIYLCVFDTEVRKLDKKNPSNPRNIQITQWRNKLYQHVLSDSPDKSPNDSTEFVDRKSGFYGIFQSCLAKHKLLYASPIRGIIADKLLTDPLPLDDLKIIEAATHHVIETPAHRVALKKYKSINWWTQSVLTGADYLCAFRDERGVVKSFKNYNSTELIELGKDFWDVSGSMNFASEFLNYIEQSVINDWDQTIYKFQRIRRNKGDICAKILVTEHSPDSEYAFLPDWYTQSAI